MTFDNWFLLKWCRNVSANSYLQELPEEVFSRNCKLETLYVDLGWMVVNSHLGVNKDA